jgi:hypothetical protein
MENGRLPAQFVEQLLETIDIDQRRGAHTIEGYGPITEGQAGSGSD